MEHLVPLVEDQACGEAIATFMTTLVTGVVSDKIADLLSSATMVILLKKDEETMAAMKATLGDAYIQPQRPLGMDSTLVMTASICALLLLRGSLGAADGPPQFSVETMWGM